MKTASPLALGVFLLVVAYVDGVHFGNNLVALWLAAGISIVLGLRVRSFMALLKAIALILVGASFATPMTLISISLLNRNFLTPNFYGKVLELGALMGLIILLPMFIFGPVTYFARSLWLRMRKSLHSD